MGIRNNETNLFIYFFYWLEQKLYCADGINQLGTLKNKKPMPTTLEKDSYGISKLPVFFIDSCLICDQMWLEQFALSINVVSF